MVFCVPGPLSLSEATFPETNKSICPSLLMSPSETNPSATPVSPAWAFENSPWPFPRYTVVEGPLGPKPVTTRSRWRSPSTCPNAEELQSTGSSPASTSVKPPSPSPRYRAATETGLNRFPRDVCSMSYPSPVITRSRWPSSLTSPKEEEPRLTPVRPASAFVKPPAPSPRYRVVLLLKRALSPVRTRSR